MIISHFVIPDIVLPVGHPNSPRRAKDREVRVKFDVKETHKDYIGFQIWFDYSMSSEELEMINKGSCVVNINYDTHIHHENGKPWTVHSCYISKHGDCTLRYWAGETCNHDYDFDAETPEMFIKQLNSLITKGRRIYPKKKKLADYSI